MYGLNPKNQMFERFATNTYAISIKLTTRNLTVLNGHHSEVSNSKDFDAVMKMMIIIPTNI